MFLGSSTSTDALHALHNAWVVVQVSLPPGTVMGIPVQVAGRAHPLRAAPADGLETTDPLPASHTTTFTPGQQNSAQGMAPLAQGSSEQFLQQPPSSAMPQALRHAGGIQNATPADAAPGDGMAQEAPATVLMPTVAQGRKVLPAGMAPGAHLQFMDRVTTPGQPARSVSRSMGPVNGVSYGNAQEPATITALTAGASHARVCLNPFHRLQIGPGSVEMHVGSQQAVKCYLFLPQYAIFCFMPED